MLVLTSMNVSWGCRMLDLLVFRASDLLPIGEISDYVNLEIDRKVDTYSTMILEIQATEENIELLKVGRILATTDNNTYGYFIEHIRYSENGPKILEIVAFSLNYILSFRTIFPQLTFRGTRVGAISNAINTHIVNPSVTARKVSNLVLGSFVNTGQTDVFSTIGDDLLNYSITLANEVNSTIDIVINHQTRKMVVNLVPFVNRSLNQSINNPVVFGDDFDNVLSSEYYKSLIEYKNSAIVAGEGEGNQRVFSNPVNFIGLNRRELFVDARDLQKSYEDEDGQQVILDDPEYMQALRLRGLEKIVDNKLIETFESEVEDYNFKYGVDYNVGDTVTVMNQTLGITLDTPVTSVVITSNADGVTYKPSLGSGVPSLYRKGVI